MHILKKTIILLLSLSFSLVWADSAINPRAQSLMAHLAKSVYQGDIATLEQDMELHFYGEGQPIEKMEMQQTIDFVTNRMAITMYVADMGQDIKMVYQNNRVVMSLQGMRLPMPAGMFPIPLDTLFNQAKQYISGGVPTDYELLSYDGMQSYDEITGEQVTVKLNEINSQNASESTEVKLLFTGEKGAEKLIAYVLQDGTDTFVMHFIKQEFAEGIPVALDVDTYHLRGLNYVLVNQTIIKNIKLNQPLDESAFK